MSYIEYPKTFKKLVEEISLTFDKDSKERCYWEINRSLERDRITIAEYNMLCSILGRI